MNEYERKIEIFEDVNNYSQPILETALLWFERTIRHSSLYLCLIRNLDEGSAGVVDGGAKWVAFDIALLECLGSRPEAREILNQLQNPHLGEGMIMHRHIRSVLAWQPGTNPAEFLREVNNEADGQFREQILSHTPDEVRIHQLRQRGISFMTGYYYLQGGTRMILPYKEPVISNIIPSKRKF